MAYTPPRGKCEPPVTTAVNFVYKRREWEHGRVLKQHEPRNPVSPNPVTLRGELKLRSFEPRPVTVAITVPVQGKPVSADRGAMTTDSTNLVLRERAGMIRWSIELQAGETKTLG